MSSAMAALAPLACFFAFAGGVNAASNYFGIAVNGQCETGTSCPPTPIPFSTAETLPVTFSYTLSNGDKYEINGQASGSNNDDGGYLLFGPTFQVTYEGNAAGGASGADTITLDWYTSFETTYGYGYFSFNLTGAFGNDITASSSATGCLNGNCQGPVAPPGSFNNGSVTYTIDASGGIFAFDDSYTPSFGVDSPVGAFIVIGQSTPLQAPKIGSFSPESGKPGASVTIKGNNFTGATSVTFQQTTAKFAVDSDTEIKAIVPCGAKTGRIQVAAPGGLATSKTNFTVTAGKCPGTLE